MTDLKTTFAGLSLRNPIIISSSGLTNSVGKNKKLAEDGAGAIVLKSLFEEQIMLEADQLKDPAFYPEASDYLEEYIREHKLSEYLTLIKESKRYAPFLSLPASTATLILNGSTLQRKLKRLVPTHWKSISSPCNQNCNIHTVHSNNATSTFSAASSRRLIFPLS